MSSSKNRGNPANPMVWIVIGVLLLAPFVGTLWVSAYARAEPALWGFPFFYWYQLLWVPIAAVCTGIAYRLVIRYWRRRETAGPGSREDTRP
jgi:hypothetical protein